MNTLPATLPRRTPTELAGWAAAVLVGLLVTLAVLFAWQALLGATPNAAGWSAPLLVVLGLLATTMAFTARLFQHPSPTKAGLPTHGGAARLLAWTPTLALAVLGAAISLRSASPAGLTAFWCLVAIEELAAAFPWLRRRAAGPNINRMLRTRADEGPADQPFSSKVGSDKALASKTSSSETSSSKAWSSKALLEEESSEAFSSEALLDEASSSEVLPDAALPDEASANEASANEALTQRLVRTRTAEGGERVVGWLRVDLLPGQRTAMAHVAFCPPLARTPSIEVAQTSGPAAQIKAVQPLPYGVRFEARLTQPALAPSNLQIRFEAFSPLAAPTPIACPPRA